MHNDWSEYESLRNDGATPDDVYLKAKADGHDSLDCIRMLRAVFNLDLNRAKEITVQAEGTTQSLDDYQETLLPVLEEAFKQLDSE